jgi:ATP-dependent DNA helicase DinG
VICYDKRLTQTSYGKRMLAGLPAYKLGTRALA